MWYNFYQSVNCILNDRSGVVDRQLDLAGPASRQRVGIRVFVPLVVWLSVGCEPYNLDRATFPVCAKPSATINYTVDQREVTFSLGNKQGDIGATGWDLGDGRYKTGERVKVAYSQPGTYAVTVVLANACDDKFTASRSITVTN